MLFVAIVAQRKIHLPIRYFFSPPLKQTQHISLIRHFHPRQAQNFRFFARKMLALQVLHMAQLGRNKVKHINIVVAIVNGVPTQACQRYELGVIFSGHIHHGHQQIIVQRSQVQHVQDIHLQDGIQQLMEVEQVIQMGQVLQI